MLVSPFFWCMSTVFQTLDTQGQVVSTTSTFFYSVEKHTLALILGRDTYIRVSYLLIQHIHFFKGCSKRRKNDDIAFTDGGEVFSTSCLLNEIDIHGQEIVIDFWIVNEFVCNMNLLARKVFDGLIGQRDGSFNTPTETKILTMGQGNLWCATKAFSHTFSILPWPNEL